MKVFVTGHKGYIGAHLVELLKTGGHQVTGCDLALFAGSEWEPLEVPDRELIKDVRHLTVDELRGHDCVMHLAAISNDPMGELAPELTTAVNLEGSVRLAEVAKAAGVPRYLFSGSCSVYGQGAKLDLEEGDALAPITAYARSKTETERRVSELADESFTPAFLRNSTAYGFSPALRIDLVANNLLGSALAYDRIKIMSDGTPWRPLVHCRDIARAFIAFMEAPRDAIFNRAVNVGGNAENYQVRDVANVVKQLVPTAEVEYTGEVGADPRNYRVKFDLLNQLLPDFKLQYDLESGTRELHQKMLAHGFGKKEFEGEQFVRLRWLKRTLSKLEGSA
ncbi:MAG: SDR family oxidoreductase [Polyangiaceae bacterium]|nr:SDR family oxidoreductase [Polyangiaceae bacterium]